MADLIELIGNTPLVELKKVNPNPKVKILAKLEGNNPGGSVKDRAALNMIKKAVARGQITPETKLIEATSGNTGIALAMLSAYFGYQIELVMPKNSTHERVQIMQAYGAKVTLLDNIEVCRDFANEKEQQGGYYQFNQFTNPDNPEAHYLSTGPEIWQDTHQQITHFVSSMGTTGTIMGVSKYLKEQNPQIQIVGCQPSEGASIPGIRRWPIEYMPKIFDSSRVDTIYDVSESQAENMACKLAREEGVFVGVSTGGQAYAALQLAEKLTSGIIVFMACDRGDRYLSSNIFR